MSLSNWKVLLASKGTENLVPQQHGPYGRFRPIHPSPHHLQQDCPARKQALVLLLTNKRKGVIKYYLLQLRVD